MPSPLTISDTGLQLIKHFEGFSATLYHCPAGIPTIGYGHALRADESFPEHISEDEASALLLHDIAAAQHAVHRLCPVALTQGQCDALVSFTFNLGAGALQRATLRRKLLRGEIQAAADGLLAWVYAGGKKSQGLLRRRHAERLLFLA
jgi:lysozyme